MIFQAETSNELFIAITFLSTQMEVAVDCLDMITQIHQNP